MPSSAFARSPDRDAEGVAPLLVDGVLAAAMAVAVVAAAERREAERRLQAEKAGIARDLQLRITDDGRGAPDAVAGAAPSGGRGLPGMAERVGLLCGTFTAGNRGGGGFEVRATLPRRLGS